jgi:lipocalin-like protein
MPVTNELIGTWALVATEWKRADGRHANPFGANAVGILTYDPGGNMSAQVMRADRPAVTSMGDIDAAMAGAWPGYIAYFGTYEIDERARVVRHRVIGSVFPAWVGGEHARRFALEGELLTLSDDLVTLDGVAVAASTTWERVG